MKPAAIALCVTLFCWAVTRLPAQPPSGQDLFERRCTGCHSLDREKEGPRLRGVFGRQAAAISGFDYSDALRKSGVKWDAVTLDKWLTDPDSLVSGADMSFRVGSPQERAAIIDYLKSLSR